MHAQKLAPKALKSKGFPAKKAAATDLLFLEDGYPIHKLLRRGFSVLKRLQGEGSISLKLSSSSKPFSLTLSSADKAMLTTLSSSGNGSQRFSLFGKLSLSDFQTPVFRRLIRSMDEQTHSENILSALLMHQTIFGATPFPPFSPTLLKKGDFSFFQGECFTQLVRLLFNKRVFGVAVRTEKELFDQLLALAGLFSAPTSAHSTFGVGQTETIFLPSFFSGARFLALAFTKYFDLKMTCNETKASCCMRTENSQDSYTCSECCLMHSRNCKKLFNLSK